MSKKIILIFLCIFLSLSVGCENKSSHVTTGSEEAIENNLNKRKALMVRYSEMPLLDQTYASDKISLEVLGNTLEGLFVLTGGNKLSYGVCESYIISNGGRTYTFNLRQNSIWSNGEPVTAHDFVFSWRRLANPDTSAKYSDLLETAKIKNSTEIIEGEISIEELGIYAKDEYTLVVELEQPVPYLINILSFPGFSPLNEKFVEEKGKDFGTSPINTLFNGPYIIRGGGSRDVSNKNYSCKKNEGYWNKNAINIDDVYVKTVYFDDLALEEYEEGGIDYINLDYINLFYDYYNNISNNDLDLASIYNDISQEDLVTMLEPSVFYLELNYNNEILSNLNARKAIALSIDKSYITNEVLDNGSISADYLVPMSLAISPEGKDFRETTDTYNHYNPQEAKRYWEKAKEELGIETSTLTFLSYDSQISNRITEYIQKQLHSNLEGLDIEIALQKFGGKYLIPTTFVDGNKINDMSIIDIKFSGWSADYLDPMAFLEMWTTNHENNEFRYSNKDYDRIIESASNGYLATHDMIRWIQLQNAERILLDEDVALVPLYQKGSKALVQEYVKNWGTNSFPPYRYWGTMDIVE